MRPTIQQTHEVSVMAEACFGYLVSDIEELSRFMTITGYSADSLRGALEAPTLAHGMMHYFASNEPALLAMCANSGISTERFMRVWQQLNLEI